jgi:cytochrome P450
MTVRGMAGPGTAVPGLGRAGAPGVAKARYAMVPRRSLPGVMVRILSDPLGGMAQLLRDHGDLVELPIPGHRFFVLGRPQDVEHVLVTRQDNYGRAFTYRLLKLFLGLNLLTADGVEYSRQRDLVEPLFSQAKVMALVPQMTAAATGALDRLDRCTDGSTIDIADQMHLFTLDMIGSAVFGFDLLAEAALVGAAVATMQTAVLAVARHPLIWAAPRIAAASTPAYRRHGAATRALDSIVARMVAGRQSMPVSEEPVDLLDVLLAGRERGDVPQRNVRDQLMTFLMLGHETTSNALSWTFMLLSAYPEARVRLEEELAQVVGARAPDAGDVCALPWTRAVLLEAMRLYPPLWTIERDALGDDEIDGVAIPAGSLMIMSPYLVHHNPAVWQDPETFDPERFLPGHTPGMHQCAFLAFGAGERGCMGRSFALLGATIALAALAQRYRFDLLETTRPPTQVRLTLRPRGGLPMTIHRIG